MNRPSWASSFRCALRGVAYALATQRNMRVHLLAMAIVVLLGWYFALSLWEWAILVLTVAMVLAAELLNTALEKTVDLITTERHPLAGMAKDLAAGAVLVTAVAAVFVGGIIFLPYLF